MINPTFEMLNQKGTPMFFSDTLANRPSAAIVGRIFISTDTNEIYRDTGTAWNLLSGGSGGSISGTINNGQVAFGTSTNTIGGSSNFLWDNSTYLLDINGDISGKKLFIKNQSQSTYISIFYPTGSQGNNLFIGGGGVNSIFTTGSSGSYNTFIGWGSGVANTSGYANTSIGYAAGTNVTTGIANSFLGYQTGFFHTTATGCTYVGVDAGFNCTTSNYNTIIGFHACGGNAGVENVLIGADTAVNNNYTGANNVFVGYRTGHNNTTASLNVFVGNLSGFSNTTAGSQVFIGADSGFSNTTGSQNTLIGYRSGYRNTTGQNNVFLGTFSGFANTTAGSQVFIGTDSGFSNTTGSQNTLIGYRSGYYNTTGASNVFIGTFSGFFNSTAGSQVFIGVESGFSNTTGASNTFIGFRSAYLNTTGYDNVYIGNNTAFDNTTGYGNVGIGRYAGYKNTTGNSNIFIGYNSGNNVSQKVDSINSIAIGNGTFTTNNNEVVLGNTNITQTILRPKLLIGHTTPFANNEDLQLTGTQTNLDVRTYSTGSIQSLRLVKNLTIPSGATISSGNSILTNVMTGTSNFAGSVTIPNSTPFSTSYMANIYNVTASAITITSSQATGIRALSQLNLQNYFDGTHTGTFTHITNLQLSGYYNNSSTISQNITNAYQLLINNIDDYGHLFTFTNRWGIYQEGASDDNYFAGRILSNSTTDTGQQVQITGSIRINNQLSGTAGGNSGQHLIVNCDGTTYKIALLNN